MPSNWLTWFGLLLIAVGAIGGIIGIVLNVRATRLMKRLQLERDMNNYPPAANDQYSLMAQWGGEGDPRSDW